MIQLRKSIISPEDMDVDDETSTFYSLALSQTETVHTAHEKDMDRFRDLLKEEDLSNTTVALEPTLHQHLVVNSSFSKTRTTAQASQEERLSGGVMAAPHVAVAVAAISSKPTKKPARKVTTAASFFAKNESPTKKQKKQGSEEARETINPRKKESTKKQPQKKEHHKKPPAKKQASTEAVDVDNDSDASTIDFSQEEKENSVNRKKENFKIGNADDFVGDEDEDDDFLESERQRKSRNAAKPRKQPQHKPPKENVEDEESAPKVHGAMDAFAQHQEKKPAEKHHKRIRRLVEKTTMDANGYLHTETQAVWEDVSDEEEPVVVRETVTKAAPVKSTKNMKQGSLMGFFKKK